MGIGRFKEETREEYRFISAVEYCNKFIIYFNHKWNNKASNYEVCDDK